MGNVSVQPNQRVPFGVMLLIKKGAVSLLILTNEFVFIVLGLSFSFRYLVELKLLQSLCGLRMGKFKNQLNLSENKVWSAEVY